MPRTSNSPTNPRKLPRLIALGGATLLAPLMAIGTASAARADVIARTPAAAPRAALASVLPAAPNKAFVVALDMLTPYQPQVSCDPRNRAGVVAFAALLKTHYKAGSTGLGRTCHSDTSEHYDGRALDWMLSVKVPAQKAAADSAVAWLTAHSGAMARRFGVSYIIWNKRMWREYAPERGWAAYTGSVPHTDHVHFSFSWDGAMKRTSWWTGKATTAVDVGPCRVYAGQYAPMYTVRRTVACPTRLPAAPTSPYAVYVVGQKSAQIAVGQKALRVTASGLFDSKTFAAVVAWQKRAHVPITGVLDKATWSRLVPTAVARPAARPPVKPLVAPKVAAKAPVAVLGVTPYTTYKRYVVLLGSRGPAVTMLQKALKVPANGVFGVPTRTALLAFQRAQRIAATGHTDRLVWSRFESRDYPTLVYRGVTLRIGAKGVPVVALQRGLRVTSDGEFGPKTQAAVKALQARSRLAQSGVVALTTWLALERQIIARAVPVAHPPVSRPAPVVAPLPPGYTIPSGTSRLATAAVRFAMAQRGKPYVYGAVGPTGYDCSGLMLASWASAGRAVTRTTYTQMHQGTATSVARLAPGDLVLTVSGGSIAAPGHVGMYIGRGLVVAAPHTGDVVKVVTYVGFVRSGVAALRHIA